MSWVAAYITVAWIIRLAMVPVILRRQLAPGASVAWLGIIFLHPFIGWSLYMLVGENRLGRGRKEQHRAIVEKFRSFDHRARHLGADWADLGASYEPMIRQAEKISGMPVLAGNSIEFFGSIKPFVDGIVADIDAAKTEVNLLYYIFSRDGTAEMVAQALERAARRGVTCRALVDAVGSR